MYATEITCALTKNYLVVSGLNRYKPGNSDVNTARFIFFFIQKEFVLSFFCKDKNNDCLRRNFFWTH